MSLAAGIVGSPNVGKSTLFNAITKASAGMANYPFATTEPNAGMVKVPDSRLARIQELIPVKKIVHTTFEFTDVASLIRGASKGEGLGNKSLENIRQADAIVHIVRALDDDNITSVTSKADPEEDINTINLRLAIADLDAVNRRIGEVQKVTQQGGKEARTEMAVPSKLKPVLKKGRAARSTEFNEDEQKIVKGLFLLTSKSVIYVANIAESSVVDPESDRYYQIIKEHAESGNAEALGTSAATEEKIASTDGGERKEFLEMGGVEESGFDRLIKAAYHILGLCTFFTAGGPEIHAWIFHEGVKAPQVAGVIHSDFERGFIRAEVILPDDLDRLEAMQEVKEVGKFRLEGRDRVVQDDDIIEFRFNV